MLSNKMTFSLTCFVMMIALAFAPVAMAAVSTVPEVNLEVTDVSSTDGSQIEAYLAITPAIREATAVDTASEIDTLTTTDQEGDVVFYLKITNEGVASLDIRGAEFSTAEDPTVTPLVASVTGTTIPTPPIAADELHIQDLSIMQYDKLGILITTVFTNTASKIEHQSDAVRDGRNFKVTLAAADVNDAAAFMLVQLPAGAFQHAAPADVRAAHFDKDNTLNTNKESGILRIELVKAEPAAGDPEPVSLVRAAGTATRGPDQGGVTGVFSQAAVSGPFNVKVTFTEEPHQAIADIIDVKRGKLTRVIKGTPFYAAPDAAEGNYTTDTDDTVPLTTGRDARYHSYLLTITPNFDVGDETVEVAIKAFDDLVKPAKRWTTPANLSSAHNRYLIIVPIDTSQITDIFKASTDAKLANEVFITEKFVVPAGGYLVITQGDVTQSGVVGSPAKIADKKTAASELYNVTHEVAFPAPGNDLEALFRIGGTIRLLHSDIVANAPATDAKVDDNGYLLSNQDYEAGSVVISEIMWGRDSSLGEVDATKSHWIELYNPGEDDISIDKNEWKLAFYEGSGTALVADTVIDEVSNSPYWLAPGSSGATSAQRRVDVVEPKDGTIAASVFESFDLGTLVSMYRKIDGTDVAIGSSPDSWAASTTAGTRNLTGLRAGTPGAATPYTAPEDPPEPPASTAPVATASDLMISEIMVSSNEGRLPQWIEIANGSAGEVSLDGWVVSIDNDAADADVIAPSIGIKLDGVVLDAGYTALVVSKTSNRNDGLDDVSASGRIVDAQAQVNPPAATYSLLSEMAFRISLEPPRAGGIADRGDVVGNLGGGWELPTSEGDDRSSIIRREMGDAGEIMGTDAAGWVLASSTGNGGAYAATYYGAINDSGTPGYDAGGALPVELSGFAAKRDPLTGTVVITWATQSELNNAGFFIKRSQQRDGKFVSVNPTMIAGAGTTAEKQSYTYTDATADPNIVYYYQIEDVSLDGNRQTLTRSHRLKGHIGAAGKATTTWGELKEQQ